METSVDFTDLILFRWVCLVAGAVRIKNKSNIIQLIHLFVYLCVC